MLSSIYCIYEEKRKEKGDWYYLWCKTFISTVLCPLIWKCLAWLFKWLCIHFSLWWSADRHMVSGVSLLVFIMCHVLRFTCRAPDWPGTVILLVCPIMVTLIFEFEVKTCITVNLNNTVGAGVDDDDTLVFS